MASDQASPAFAMSTEEKEREMEHQMSCAVCQRNGKFFMGWEEPEGVVRYGIVCGTHDHYYGRKNLAAAFRLTSSAAAAYDRALDEEARRLDGDKP